LFVIDTLQVGGSERSLLEILSAFRSVEPVMVPVYPGKGATLHEQYRARGIRVVPLEVPGKYAFREAIARLLRVLEEERPELVHTTLFRSDVIGRIAGRACGLPVISSFVNDNYAGVHFDSLSKKGWIKHRGVQAIDLATSKLVTRFCANSETMKSSNARALFIELSKIDVIHRGRPIDAFANVTANARAGLGIAADVPLIVNVARLLRRKGQDDLLEAMPAILGRFPRARLLIAGEGPFRAHLEEMIARLNLREAVTLLGSRNDIPALLHAADVFVNASEYEGHPGAVVEAMLSGRPPVLSDIAVHREMIRQGETGAFFQLHDVNGLASAVLDLLLDPAKAKELGARAQRFGVERFDVKKVAEHHERLYASVLKDSSTGRGASLLGPLIRPIESLSRSALRRSRDPH
jgi:glycosyltransferase involved in cell wall biosynthesis